MAEVEVVEVFSPETARKVIKSFKDNNGFEKCSSIMLKLQKCINKGQNATRQLESLVKEIDPLHKFMAATRLGGVAAQAGGIVSVVAGVTAGIVGIATGGVGALPLAAIALGTSSVASGLSVTAGSSLIEDKVISKKGKQAESSLSKYQEAVEEVKQAWDHVEQLCEKISIEENLTEETELLSFLWTSFLDMRQNLNCSEVWTALTNVAIPSATIQLFKKALEYVTKVLPYAAYQLYDAIQVLINGQRHTTVKQIEENHLPNLKEQINRLKIAKDEFARAQK